MLEYLRAHALDRDLAAGVQSWHSPAHAARSRRLTSARYRRSLARCLDRLVQDAELAPVSHRFVPVPPSRTGVREARPLMLTVAARLRGDAPVDAHGVAALHELLCNGAGPVYVSAGAAPDALARRLAAIDRWLDVPA